MNGLIGTGEEYKGRALSGFLRESGLKSQRELAKERIGLAYKAEKVRIAETTAETVINLALTYFTGGLASFKKKSKPEGSFEYPSTGPATESELAGGLGWEASPAEEGRSAPMGLGEGAGVGFW